MPDESASAPKYRRGENPRSLANLRPPWTQETRPDAAPRGPLVGPALKRFAAMPMEELQVLLAQVEEGKPPRGMTVAEGLALVLIRDAFTAGVMTTGSKSRELLFERVDGAPEKTAVRVDVAVGVNLQWADGEPA